MPTAHESHEKQPRSWRSIAFTIALGASWLASAPIVLLLVAQMFINAEYDTTTLSNAAFGIVMVAANVTFSYARALPPEVRTTKCVVSAAECYLLSGMTFAAASVLKYGILSEVAQQHANDSVLMVAGWFAAVCFLTAVILGYAGIREQIGFFLHRNETRL
jgi:hypothetical protein